MNQSLSAFHLIMEGKSPPDADGFSKSSPSSLPGSSLPGQHNFSYHPTPMLQPSHDQNLFPSPQPLTLARGTQYHHGFMPHCNSNDGKAADLSTRDEDSTSLLGKNLLSSYSPPTFAKNETPSSAQVPPPALPAPPTSVITRDSPYFSHPSLPPLSNPTVSPYVDPRKDPASASAIVYQNSPYFSEAPNLDTTITGSSESSGSSASATSRPVPARSAFMCFAEANGQAISDRIGTEEGKTEDGKGRCVEAVAAEWRSLPKQDKAYWEAMAKNDLTRFADEKKAYKGPITRKLRTKKNPLAPKRPMSAFLMFAQQKRRPLQRENPDMLNADISRLLGELWRNISLAEKRPFLEREKLERKIYKAKVEAFKNDEKLANSFKSPTAAMKKARDTRKKKAREPRLVFSASCTREESHCDQKEPMESTVESDPRIKERSVSSNEATIANFSSNGSPERSNTFNEEATGEERQAPYYEFNTSNYWPPMHYHQNPARRRKYTYQGHLECMAMA